MGFEVVGMGFEVFGLGSKFWGGELPKMPKKVPGRP